MSPAFEPVGETASPVGPVSTAIGPLRVTVFVEPSMTDTVSSLKFVTYMSPAFAPTDETEFVLDPGHPPTVILAIRVFAGSITLTSLSSQFVT